jgi:transglutaminase-like putative cysteine protease
VINAPRARLPVADRSVIILLWATLVVAAPLGWYLPAWVSAVFVVCGAWRMMTAVADWPSPTPLIRVIMALLGLTGVLLQNGTVLGRDAGVALLVLMASLKLLELNTRRDAHVVIVLNYFMLLTHFLFSQSLYAAAYMAVGILAVTAVLNQLNYETAQRPVAWHLRFAASVAAQSLPLLVVMFFLFPRFGGAIWSVPGNNGTASTGLSADMAPGEISRLSQSNAVAFRVKFTGDMPGPRSLYWRGPVLWYTDGLRWTRGGPAGVNEYPRDHDLYLIPRGDPISYEVTLEPHDEHWLFALDLPVSAPRIGRITPDYQILSDRRVTRRVHYPVTSFVRYTTGPLDDAQRRDALQLPPGNPRTRALARRWRSELHSDVRIVERALNYFHSQPFIYTMTPPPLRGDRMDDFLFTTRRGFCEHYASSFTWLMRASGIPARIVTGYQGGELNPLGNYLIVRQSDAHAWTEVWLKGRGWVRVDPTAAVAPSRIQLGFDPIAQPDGEPVLFGNASSRMLARLWRDMRFGWDAVNYNWDQWVLGYTRFKQLQLLTHLGLGMRSWQAIALGMAAGVGVMFFLVGLWVLHKNTRNRDRTVRAYQRFCNKLARCGIRRAPWEGPAAFAARVAAQRPDLGEAVNDISRLYMALRYGGRPLENGLHHLKHRVRAFHP